MVSEPIDPQYAQSSASLGAAYLASILPALEQTYQLDIPVLLQRAGIDQQCLNDPQHLIPFYRVGAFFLDVLQATGDQAIGLVVGSGVQPRSYQTLGYAVLSSDTLREAIARLIRYEHLIGKLGTTSLEETDPVRLVWHCPFAGPWARYLKEAAITGWVVFGRSLLVDDIRAYSVHFDHPCLSDPARYQAIYGCPVYFDSDWCGVTFAASHLDAPLKSADPGLSELMEKHARGLLAEFGERLNLANEVRERIARQLPNGEPVMEGVASALGLTPRVLQNRLKALGVGYTDLVDDVRIQLALAYLDNEAHSLIDVAFLLGFSEQSSFSRAFKRWTGQTPLEYRRSRHHIKSSGI